MNFSQLIRKPFRWVGILPDHKKGEEWIPPDIARDSGFLTIYKKIQPYTMVGVERSYALYQSVKYIVSANIPGDFVECGVWRGGSSMLMVLTLLQLGVVNRPVWLYDTYSGMTKPGDEDGETEKQEWEKLQTGADQSNWCLAQQEEVATNLRSTGYPFSMLQFVKGKVEDTIPAHIPDQIAMLRLDTDWYASTRHELIHLYPRLQKNGVLLLDDYGYWKGCRKATDEYFEGRVLLHRIDNTGRILVKQE